MSVGRDPIPFDRLQSAVMSATQKTFLLILNNYHVKEKNSPPSQKKEAMSQRKRKPENRPSLSTPLAAPPSSSSLHLTCFHQSKPLYAVATTAIGQNVIRIYDTDRPVQEVRCEIRLKRDEEVSCLAWTGYDGKKRKRVQSSAGELVCGLISGKIHVMEQASGEIVRSLEGHTAAVTAWSVDDDKGWSCGGDGKIKCWDPRTGSCLAYDDFLCNLLMLGLCRLRSRDWSLLLWLCRLKCSSCLHYRHYSYYPIQPGK